MAERGNSWAAPPPLPSYENAWNGADQPPSYEEALVGAGPQLFQAPTTAGAVYPNPVYPPLPNYQQAGGASSAWPQNTVAHNGQVVMAPTAASAAYPNASTNPAYPPLPNVSTNPAYPPLPTYQPPGASPAWPQNALAQDSQRVMSNDELLVWWRNVEPWERMSHSSDKDPRELAGKVQRVLNALQVYGLLMRTQGETLQKHVGELNRASNDVSRSSETRKVAKVTGGTTKAVGSAAAVAGIVLAPITMGVSLAITAVGVGVLAAGGITKSKIKGQAVLSHDRRALETNVQDYQKRLGDIEACLRFIHTGMECIKQRKLSVLKGANMDPGRVSRMLELSGAVAQGMAAAGGSSELLRSFAGGLGTFYSKKNSQVLKKSKVDKFGKTLHKVAQRLQSTLNDLRKTADSLSRF